MAGLRGAGAASLLAQPPTTPRGGAPLSARRPESPLVARLDSCWDFGASAWPAPAPPARSGKESLAVASFVLTPRGGVLTPRSRPQKLKALGVEASLVLVPAAECSGGGALAERAAEEDKEEASRLKKKAKALQQLVDRAQEEKEAQAKEVAEARSRAERLGSEHAILQAKHTWAKSSLEAALAAQDECRKNYEHVDAAVKKVTAQLARKEQEAGGHAQQTEAERAKGELSAKEAQFEKERDQLRKALQQFKYLHREASRAVLERVASGQASAALRLALLAWARVARHEAATAETAKALEALKETVQQRRSQVAKTAGSVLERLSMARDSGVAVQVFQSWAELAKVNEGATGQAPGQAPAPAGKEEDAMGSLGRLLSRQIDGALLAWAVRGWLLLAVSAREALSAEKKGEGRLAVLAAAEQALRARLAQREEELEDAREELEESSQKEKFLQAQVLEIMELHSSIGTSLGEMELLMAGA